MLVPSFCVRTKFIVPYNLTTAHIAYCEHTRVDFVFREKAFKHGLVLRAANDTVRVVGRDGSDELVDTSWRYCNNNVFAQTGGKLLHAETSDRHVRLDRVHLLEIALLLLEKFCRWLQFRLENKTIPGSDQKLLRR